jgi:hypothetical protein
VYITKSKIILYRILNKKNKIWRIIPGHLTVKRKGTDAIGDN